jgi:SEC-C motif-containing protein
MERVTPTRCPCGSGDSYADCCGRLHRGEATAATARALMQSRFSAFAVGDEPYLLATWHPSTRPDHIGLDEQTRWTRLDIVDVSDGGPFDTTGIVEFRAHYRRAGAPGTLQERSSFMRHEGQWRYVRAEPNPQRPTA